MMLLLVAAALACDPAASIAPVRERGDHDGYLCLMTDPAARDVLTAAIDAGGEPPERLTRALTLWLLERSGEPFDVALLRRLNASDRRLLSDGVRARRGRASPVPEHAEVFAQFAWYKPSKGYTDARLTASDRANIASSDRPPPDPSPSRPAPRTPPAPSPPAVDAPATELAGTPSADRPNLCGCDSAGGVALLLPLLGLRRRRS